MEEALLLELGDDTPHAAVHDFDLSGVDFHAPLLPLLVLRLPPRRHPGIAGRERPTVFDEPHADHPCVALPAERVPARGVAALIAGNVFLRRVQRPVRRGESHVEEERILPAAVAVDVADGVIGDGVGVVEVRRIRLDQLVVAGESDGVPVAAGPVDGAEVVVEAALAGPVVFVALADRGHMPLAAHERRVTGGFERLSDGDALAVQVAAIAGQPEVAHHVADAGLVGVEAGEQAGAGGAAAGGVVELGEADAARGQPVDVGRADLAAVTAEVGKAHVVGHHQDDVGPRGGGGLLARAGRGQRGAGGAHQTEEFAAADAFHSSRIILHVAPVLAGAEREQSAVTRASGIKKAARPGATGTPRRGTAGRQRRTVGSEQSAAAPTRRRQAGPCSHGRNRSRRRPECRRPRR